MHRGQWEPEGWKKEETGVPMIVWFIVAFALGCVLVAVFPTEFEPLPLVPTAEERAAIEGTEAEYWRDYYCTPSAC